MLFKETHIQEEFWKISPKLRLILCEAEWFFKQRNHEIVVTCLMRTEDEQRKLFEEKQAEAPTSVHMYGRGADIRLIKHPTFNEDLVAYLNSTYIYDITRPSKRTAMIHGGTGEHCHIQCI